MPCRWTSCRQTASHLMQCHRFPTQIFLQATGYLVRPLPSISCIHNHFRYKFSSMPRCQTVKHHVSSASPASLSLPIFRLLWHIPLHPSPWYVHRLNCFGWCRYPVTFVRQRCSIDLRGSVSLANTLLSNKYYLMSNKYSAAPRAMLWMTHDRIMMKFWNAKQFYKIKRKSKDIKISSKS